MPELPEVETTLLGIRPALFGAKIVRVVVRERRLRREIDADLAEKVEGQVVKEMRRRGKYIVIHFKRGGLLMHLGMSGSFSVLGEEEAGEKEVGKHAHYDLWCEGGDGRVRVVRYRDPRRFGRLVWCAGEPMRHRLIRGLGVEPLDADFDGGYLADEARGRKVAVKSLLMDGRVVVGIGNIYACEALFAAGIDPRRPCGEVSQERYERLCGAAKRILGEAIDKGGTTLRDFSADGKMGYFAQELRVYGREGEGCGVCGGVIRKVVLGQRGTYFCGGCQG